MTATRDESGGRNAALFVLAAAIMVALTVAWRIDAVATSAPPAGVYQIQVIDENNTPIAGATVTVGEQSATTDGVGSALFRLDSPQLAIVHAESMISDAIVIGTAERQASTLRLLAREGPTGRRTVLHFGGDFMMGRRFGEAADGETALVSDEASARSIVADIGPLFRIADLSMVNLESVTGTLAIANAYPGKRFLLQSPPESLAALEELGVDLVTLGNNHIYDWLEAGVASTIRNLDSAGIAHAGGGLTADDAQRPAVVNAGGLQVGVVSMTTVTGDYVNDHLPDATAPIPATVAATDLWQYETRYFGFGRAGDPAYVAPATRRPGTMWRLYDELETALPVSDAADLWQEMIRVYPELQDWVARRGHGGAARFSPAALEESIAAAKHAGADIVVVHLHGGFQYADVPSDYFTAATSAAVEAGADLVIGHHPHVIQGIAFSDDTLIAHSLGNIVFDQDFLVTHPSVVLRVVFEGRDFLAATLYPVLIDGYRPVAAGGAIADRIIRQVNEASLQEARSVRLPDGRIGSTRTETTATATVTADQGRGVVTPSGRLRTEAIRLVAGVPVSVPNSLVETGDTTRGLRLGRDLFGYGDLEDAVADGATQGGQEWALPPESLAIDLDSPAGPWTVRLDRTSQHVDELVARTGARVPLPAHRWFDRNGSPADATARYAVHVWARRVGAGIPFARVVFYEFDDTDPTRDPDSVWLETVDVALPLVNDGEWHELWVDLPPPPARANSALAGIGLAPPASQSGTVWVDDFDVVEWRAADAIPPGMHVAVDYVQSPADTVVTLVTP